jgi:hypothetical protein
MKGKPPKEILDRRAIRQQSHPEPKPTKRWPWKMIELILGIGIGVAGLTLTALQFQARPTVSLDTPLNPGNALSAPVILSNDGLVDINDVKIIWYTKELKAANGAQSTHALDGGVVPDSAVLEVGQRKTMPSPLDSFIKTEVPLTAADMVMGVYFRPSYWPFQKHKLFHLVGVRPADGGMKLQLQPNDAIRQEYEDMVTRRGAALLKR